MHHDSCPKCKGFLVFFTCGIYWLVMRSTGLSYITVITIKIRLARPHNRTAYIPDRRCGLETARHMYTLLLKNLPTHVAFLNIVCTWARGIAPCGTHSRYSIAYNQSSGVISYMCLQSGGMLNSRRNHGLFTRLSSQCSGRTWKSNT